MEDNEVLLEEAELAAIDVVLVVEELSFELLHDLVGVLVGELELEHVNGLVEGFELLGFLEEVFEEAEVLLVDLDLLLVGVEEGVLESVKLLEDLLAEEGDVLLELEFLRLDGGGEGFDLELLELVGDFVEGREVEAQLECELLDTLEDF